MKGDKLKEWLQDFQVAQQEEAQMRGHRSPAQKSQATPQTPVTMGLETPKKQVSTPSTISTQRTASNSTTTFKVNVGSRKTRTGKSKKEDIVFLFRQKCEYLPLDLGGDLLSLGLRLISLQVKV